MKNDENICHQMLEKLGWFEHLEENYQIPADYCPYFNTPIFRHRKLEENL
jgi:hypothetical protein